MRLCMLIPLAPSRFPSLSCTTYAIMFPAACLAHPRPSPVALLVASASPSVNMSTCPRVRIWTLLGQGGPGLREGHDGHPSYCLLADAHGRAHSDATQPVSASVGSPLLQERQVRAQTRVWERLWLRVRVRVQERWRNRVTRVVDVQGYDRGGVEMGHGESKRCAYVRAMRHLRARTVSGNPPKEPSREAPGDLGTGGGQAECVMGYAMAHGARRLKRERVGGCDARHGSTGLV